MRSEVKKVRKKNFICFFVKCTYVLMYVCKYKSEFARAIK